MKVSVTSFLRLERILDAEKKSRDKLLIRSGAYIRRIARNFVRHKRNPDEHSEPLHSPYDHFGLRNSIIFDTDDSAAYVGPRYIKKGLANVARLHEFGGSKVVKDLDGRMMNGVSIGDTAPVTESHVTKKDNVLKSESRRDEKTGQKVFWIKIRKKYQAEHASRLYRRFMPLVTESKLVKYPPRPYMHPALIKSLPYLSKMWKDSVKAK